MTGPAHVIGPIDVPLLADTIPAMFDRVVAAHPDRDALVAPFQHVRLSYRELAEQVDRVARGLLALGVQPGDRVGMWSPNNVEWVYVQFAAASVGAVLVNLNPAYRTDELVYAVTQSACRVLISARRFKTSDYTAMVAEAREQLPDVEHVVFLDTRDWDDMLAAGVGVRPTELAARHHTMSAHDPVNIQYTSGTTGSPKGATLSHHNLVNNGYFVGASFGYTERDRVCTRGYSVMLGYWDDPDRTAEAVDGEGWMHSGDVATIDADGYVRIVGRIKDLIIRGGENISPREIEEFLHTMPGIIDVQVVGVPDPLYGEELMAWVRVDDGVTLTRDDVMAFSNGRIAHFKVPRYLHVTDDFPMTVTGKVQKYKLRDLSIDLLNAATATT